MKFYSTRNKDLRVSLRDAVLQGLPADQGLFMPEIITRLPQKFFSTLRNKSFQEMSLEVASHLIGDDVPTDELKNVVERAVEFGAPLRKVENDVFALELFHGPTLAFKDFGARFLSGLLAYFIREREEITVLVATSGDTGSAVANGFFNIPGTRVMVLYPSGKITDIQEKQFTTLGGNVTALEVEGTFDDCQEFVKRAFRDEDLKTRHRLTSANSINVARLIPQTFYYFYAYSRLPAESRRVVFSVPSGNFGNLTAGLIAKRMGLPVGRFVAATNRNDIVPNYLRTGQFVPSISRVTLSSAMDVGNPSNFVRMLDLYASDVARLSQDVAGYSFSDEETLHAMKRVASKGYVLDPHGAVAYLGLKKYQEGRRDRHAGIFLETAHPGKFSDIVARALGKPPELPEKLRRFAAAEKKSVRLPNDFSALKEYLMNLMR